MATPGDSPSRRRTDDSRAAALAGREQAAREARHWVRLTRCCNNRCLFCLDALSQNSSHLPTHVIRGEIIDGRKRDAARLILSGGEPTTQPEFLRALLERCVERDIHTAVDTCGLTHPEVFRSIAETTDLFLFDLKLMDPERHRELTGATNDVILGNLTMLSDMGKEIRVRIPVIPAATDAPDNFDAIGSFVSDLANPPRVTLLPHHSTAMEKYSRFDMIRRLPRDTRAPSKTDLENYAYRLARYGLEVRY